MQIQIIYQEFKRAEVKLKLNFDEVVCLQCFCHQWFEFTQDAKDPKHVLTVDRLISLCERLSKRHLAMLRNERKATTLRLPYAEAFCAWKELNRRKFSFGYPAGYSVVAALDKALQSNNLFIQQYRQIDILA